MERRRNKNEYKLTIYNKFMKPTVICSSDKCVYYSPLMAIKYWCNHQQRNQMAEKLLLYMSNHKELIGSGKNRKSFIVYSESFKEMSASGKSDEYMKYLGYSIKEVCINRNCDACNKKNKNQCDKYISAEHHDRNFQMFVLQNEGD